jgi:glycosyltransferase involved in cell wall biosynthesis
MFPNKAQPVHAVFVRNRISRVARKCKVHVLSPIPWFPLDGFVPKYRHRKSIPRSDTIDGMPVEYPRFLSIPAILKPLDGFFLFISVWLTARRIRKEFDFDLIDAHLAFPDGFGCALLARLLRKPLTITLRGHDVNDVPRFPVRCRQVQHALKRADRVIGVADALRQAAVDLGCDESKTVTISNGVDADVFQTCPRLEARQRLNLPLDRRIVLSVGHLVERKGFHLIVDALDQIRRLDEEVPYLVVVGGPGEEGDYSGVIRERIESQRLEKDVLLAGPQLNHTLCDWYNAADVFCLASSKEGWANVLLESLACGTPVVGTKVWGTPEVICSPDYGILVERTKESIAGGLIQAFETEWNRRAISTYARSQTWEHVADQVIENFRLAIGVETPSQTALTN